MIEVNSKSIGEVERSTERSIICAYGDDGCFCYDENDPDWREGPEVTETPINPILNFCQSMSFWKQIRSGCLFWA